MGSSYNPIIRLINIFCAGLFLMVLMPGCRGGQSEKIVRECLLPGSTLQAIIKSFEYNDTLKNDVAIDHVRKIYLSNDTSDLNKLSLLNSYWAIDDSTENKGRRYSRFVNFAKSLTTNNRKDDTQQIALEFAYRYALFLHKDYLENPKDIGNKGIRQFYKEIHTKNGCQKLETSTKTSVTDLAGEYSEPLAWLNNQIVYYSFCISLLSLYLFNRKFRRKTNEWLKKIFDIIGIVLSKIKMVVPLGKTLVEGSGRPGQILQGHNNSLAKAKNEPDNFSNSSESNSFSESTIDDSKISLLQSNLKEAELKIENLHKKIKEEDDNHLAVLSKLKFYESRIYELTKEKEELRINQEKSERLIVQLETINSNYKSQIVSFEKSSNRPLQNTPVESKAPSYQLPGSGSEVVTAPPGALYARLPYGNMFSHFSPVFVEGDTPFVITPTSPNDATFTLVNHRLTLESVFSMTDRLKDACELLNINQPTPDNFSPQPGRLVKDGDHWRIVTKMTLNWK